MPKEKYYTSTVTVYEPDVNGNYDTEPYIYVYKSTEKMDNDGFNKLLKQCVEIERIAQGTVLSVDVVTDCDGEYVDSDTYLVTLLKVELSDEPSPFIDWEKCHPNMPKIFKIKEFEIGVEVE